MALHEVRLIMSRVLWNFDLELCESRGWMNPVFFLLWVKQPLVVRAKMKERTRWMKVENEVQKWTVSI